MGLFCYICKTFKEELKQGLITSIKANYKNEVSKLFLNGWRLTNMGILLLFSIGGPEILVILLAILLLFGSKKIPELARGLGKGLNEFKRAANDIKQEINDSSKDINNDIDDMKNSLK